MNKIIGKVYNALPKGKIKAKLEQKLLHDLKKDLKGWSHYQIKNRDKAKQQMCEAIDQIFNKASPNTLIGLKLLVNYFNPVRIKKGEEK